MFNYLNNLRLSFSRDKGEFLLLERVYISIEKFNFLTVRL